MNKNTVLSFLALIGALLGFSLARIENIVTWLSVLDGCMGAFLFWNLGRAYYDKYPDAIIGIIIGASISVLSELLAGSEVVIRTKWVYMCMGLFIWPVRKQWRFLTPGGLIGGVVGFIWGMNDVRWFGNARLEPGLLNASLMGVEFGMVGMCVAIGALILLRSMYGDENQRHFERKRHSR